MSMVEQLDARSCVLLRLGDRRFALAAEQIAELVAPSRVFRFAHRTTEIDGVILRRGRVVPSGATEADREKTDVAAIYLVATQKRELRLIGSPCRSVANAN
jgi:hypothetical protein